MEQNKAQVAADLRRVANFLQGLVGAADLLDQMQALDEAAAAAEKRVTEAEERAARIDLEASNALADAVSSKNAASDALMAAREEAKRIVEDAKVHAGSIIGSADDKVAAAFDAATIDAQKRNEALERNAEELTGELANLIERKRTLDLLLADMQVKHDKLAADIVDMQRKAAQMAGLAE